MIANREPRRATALASARPTIAATKVPTGAVAASRSSDSIARLTIHGIPRAESVAATRHATPNA